MSKRAEISPDPKLFRGRSLLSRALILVAIIGLSNSQSALSKDKMIFPPPNSISSNSVLQNSAEENLVGTQSWVLTDASCAHSLSLRGGAVEINAANSLSNSLVQEAKDSKSSTLSKAADRGVENSVNTPVLLKHGFKLSHEKKAVALHIHFQAMASKPERLGIEVLVPEYPYPHSLNETRTLTPEWRIFDFDCITSSDDNLQSLFFKLKRDCGAVSFKDVAVKVTPMRALGLNPDDLCAETLERNIEKNRKGRVLIEVRDEAGKPVPNAEIRISQLSKKFLFGTEVQGLKPQDDSVSQVSYQQKLISLCNFATVTPYWPQVEAVPGRTDFTSFDQQVAWLTTHNFVIKVTPVFWPHWAPSFLPGDPKFAVPLAIKNLQEFTSHFGRLSVTFIENNEVAAAVTDSIANGLINWVLIDGPAKVLQQVTAIERNALDSHRHQQLIYNDYENGQTEFDMLDQLQREHALPDAIGIEMHMTQGEWPLERVDYIVKRLSKYNRPLYVSEISVVSGDHRLIPPNAVEKNWKSTAEGEVRQSEYVEKLYKLLFSEKEVQGITWWDFTDRDAWQGAPRGLLRTDMSAKPAFSRLQDLIASKWQSNITARTDSLGNFDAKLFEGEYRVAIVAGTGTSRRESGSVVDTKAETIRVDSSAAQPLVVRLEATSRVR